MNLTEKQRQFVTAVFPEGKWNALFFGRPFSLVSSAAEEDRLEFFIVDDMGERWAYQMMRTRK